MNLRAVKEVVTASEALADWLDGESPVHPIVAEMRAARCATGNNGQPCQFNKESGWWDRVKSRIAIWIRRELEVKEGLNLRVSTEEQLAMCKACGCCLRLKVWCPSTVLRRHFKPDQFTDAPDYCWVRKELSL